MARLIIYEICYHYLAFDTNGTAYEKANKVIKEIREKHNIVGTPVGTLLQLPTQNLLLGLPIEYTPEEISLLQSRNAIILQNGVKASRPLRTKRKPQQAF